MIIVRVFSCCIPKVNADSFIKFFFSSALTPFLKRLDDFLQNPFFKNEDSQQFFFMAIRRIVAERKEETVPRVINVF